jgi:hypothetical protein
MIFDLTDDDREALEALRVKMGLRSHAETLRALIRGGPVVGDPIVISSSAGAIPDGTKMKVTAPQSIQIGPTTSTPGSRLKPDKVKR